MGGAAERFATSATGLSRTYVVNASTGQSVALRIRPKERTVVKGVVDVLITTEGHDWYSRRYDASDAEAQDT